MTVKKKVNESIESFVDKGADVKPNKERVFKNVLVRVPERILAQLDESNDAELRLSRTRWILQAIIEKLKNDHRAQ